MYLGPVKRVSVVSCLLGQAGGRVERGECGVGSSSKTRGWVRSGEGAQALLDFLADVMAAYKRETTQSP